MQNQETIRSLRQADSRAARDAVTWKRPWSAEGDVSQFFVHEKMWKLKVGGREKARLASTQRGMCESFLVLPLLEEHDWPFCVLLASLGIQAI